jgi:hypothetical protein
MSNIEVITHRDVVSVDVETNAVNVVPQPSLTVAVSGVGIPGPQPDPVTIDLALLYQISKL